MFVSQAISSIISSFFLIIGASILLLSINWKLALGVLAMLPIIGGTFHVVLGKVRKLFKKSQEAIDWLNKVINESILGSALDPACELTAARIRKIPCREHRSANDQPEHPAAVRQPDSGHYLLHEPCDAHDPHARRAFRHSGSMTLGDFTAFNSYLAILIFPVIVIGFMSNVIAQASASFSRLSWY